MRKINSIDIEVNRLFLILIIILSNNYDSALVGAKLGELRTEKAIGQNQLAKELESTSYWKNQKQESIASVLFKLARYFNVSVEYILGLED